MSTVLIVEDDPSVAQLLTTVLGDAGHRVEVAGDGRAGLLELDTIGADAVVLDPTMPDIGGVRVLAQLADDHGDQLPVPVVVVTGSPDAVREVAAWVPPDDVLSEPFDPDQLLDRIHAHLTPGRSHP